MIFFTVSFSRFAPSQVLAPGGFDGFGSSGAHCLSYKIRHNEAAVAVLTVLAVSAVMAVSVMTATPLKLNPPFPGPNDQKKSISLEVFNPDRNF